MNNSSELARLQSVFRTFVSPDLKSTEFRTFANFQQTNSYANGALDAQIVGARMPKCWKYTPFWLFMCCQLNHHPRLQHFRGFVNKRNNAHRFIHRTPLPNHHTPFQQSATKTLSRIEPAAFRLFRTLPWMVGALISTTVAAIVVSQF